MSYNFNVAYYVFGRDKYSEITPVPAEALGYFSTSVIQVSDADFPTGEFRLAVKDLTEEQQAPQTGRNFAVVNVDIDFTKKMSNSAREIEKLVQANVAQALAKQGAASQKPADPLVSKPKVDGSIVRVKEKLQPGNISQDTGTGWTSPITQDGAVETYDPILHTDTAGLLCFIISPLKSWTGKTSDNPAVTVRFNFADQPRP